MSDPAGRGSRTLLSNFLVISLFIGVFGCGGGSGGDSAGRGGQSGAAPGGGESTPLTLVLLKQTEMEDHEFFFSEDLRARKVRGRDVMAVEMVRFGILPDTTALWTFVQMESLNAAGVMDQSTRTFAVFSRAIIKGDSTEVAAIVARGGVNWHRVPKHQKYPANGIHRAVAERQAEQSTRRGEER